MAIKCPNCNSGSLSDVTGKYSLKDGAMGVGISGVIGALLFGPVGAVIGAGLGTLAGTSEGKDKKGNQIPEYKCNSCGNRFPVCPKCRNILTKEEFEGNLSYRAGYTISKGSRCASCKNVISNPYYNKIQKRKPNINRNINNNSYNEYNYDYDDYDDD